MRNIVIFLLSLVALACTPATPVKTSVEQLCREDSEANVQMIKLKTSQGWTYQGPLYNNGINCTVGLWACYDTGAACAK